jgi:sulfatase-like protein
MTIPTSSKNAPRVAAFCLAVATLLFARQITLWAGPENRFYLHWQRVDTWILIFSLLAVALLFYLIVIIVRRASWGGVFLRWLTIVLIADILVGYAASGKSGGPWPALAAAAWVVLAGIGLYAASRPGSRFLERGTTILAALAWLAPISVMQILLWKPWDVRPTIHGLEAHPPPANRNPVFLFVFDEWSYQRSYDGQELRPFFRNLRQLASHSLEFTDAHSQAGSTNPSVPRLIFQRDGLLKPKNGIAVWEQGDSTVPSAKLPTIFAAAGARGYQTSLIGFYFPYRAVLGDQVERIVNEAYVPKDERLQRRVAWVLARNLQFLADPLSRFLWELWNSSTISENWVHVNHSWRVAVRDLIRRSDANTFAMIHWPLPHGPYVLNENGTLHKRFKGARMEGTPADYQRHLAYLDLVLGEAMAELDSAGLLDRALVIVTSDHSWKHDPDSSLRAAPGAPTWVPLIVKLPHQTAGHLVPERFCLGQLGALLQRVMDTTLTARNGPREVAGLPSSTTCARRGEHTVD